MPRVVVKNKWVGKGTDVDPYRPLLLDVLNPETYEDVSGISPPLIVPTVTEARSLVRITDAQLAQLLADVRFGPSSIVATLSG